MNDNDNEEAFEVFDAAVSTIVGIIKLLVGVAVIAFASGALYASLGG